MKILFIFLIIPQVLVAQESRIRVLSEKKNSDTEFTQIAELTVFNNSSFPICIKVSTWLLGDLSKDTVELAQMGDGNDCYYYDLALTKKDFVPGIITEAHPSYPLVLNEYTSFVVTLKLNRKINCKKANIKFAYINLYDSKWDILQTKFKKGDVWDSNPQLKFNYKTINF